jgi:RNA polymerase sigma-70 factor (ECF subfamily)
MNSKVALGPWVPQAPVDESDEELIGKYLRGDATAIEQLLARHAEALYRICRCLVHDPDDAEDIYQEAQSRAVANIATLRTPSTFRGWLMSIARNCARDGYRRHRRLCPLPEDDDTLIELHCEDPQLAAEQHEEYRLVSEALDRINKHHREVLILRDVQGMSYKEIAVRLDVSHSAVETLLFRARHSLRREYVRRAG